MSKAKNQNNMTFIEHANEFRWRLLISIIATVVCFAFLIIFSKGILSFLTLPLKSLGYELNFYKVHEAFFSTLKASFFAAFVLTMPIWIWMISGFIVPALEKKQKGLFLVILLVSLIFIASGFLFSYKVLIPISLNYLLSFGKGEINSVISIDFYLTFFLTLFFTTGIGFQLPLIILFLNRIGILHKKILQKGRKFSILIMLLVSAILTPPDVISQIILGVPLYLLYELSIIFVTIFGKNKVKEKKKQVK